MQAISCAASRNELTNVLLLLLAPIAAEGGYAPLRNGAVNAQRGGGGTAGAQIDGTSAAFHIDSAFLPRHYTATPRQNYYITITALSPVVSGGAAFLYSPGSFKAAKRAAAALPAELQAAVGPGACYGHGYADIDLPTLVGQGRPESEMSGCRRVAQEVTMEVGDMLVLDPMLSHSGSCFREGVTTGLASGGGARRTRRKWRASSERRRVEPALQGAWVVARRGRRRRRTAEEEKAGRSWASPGSRNRR